MLSKVSVVIPVYNGSKHIERCVSVLKEQTHTDLDVIFVVDAKTTDDTVELIGKHSAGDPRFRVVIQNDDRRMGGARNIGMDAAEGEYLWFLDVDDRPYPSLIEETVSIAEEKDVPVVAFNSIYSCDWGLPEKVYGKYSVEVMSGMEAVYRVGDGKLSVCPWSKVFRTDFLRSNGIRFIAGYCEDLDQTVRAFLLSGKVAYYNKPLYVYYQHQASLCGGANDDAIAQRDVELAEELGREVKRLFPDDYDMYCAYMARHTLRSLTRASKEKAAELSRTESIRELVSHKQPGFNAEVLVFKISPGLYFRIGRWARGRKFSGEDVLFDSGLS